MRQALDRFQPVPIGGQLSLAGDGQDGALLEYHEPGTVSDPARLEAILGLVAATLRHLAARGVIGETARRTP